MPKTTSESSSFKAFTVRHLRWRRGTTGTILALLSLVIIYVTSCMPAYQNVSDGAASIRQKFQSSLTDRPLVLYVYSHSQKTRPNFEYFIAKALHGKADFIFIINGETDVVKLIPELPNVRVVQRNNSCYDLGSYGEVLRTDNLWKKYKRFITINASVRGPFFPNYARQCWTDTFLNRLNDRVKLVGTSINCHYHPHLQSMVLATDNVGMSLLLDHELATSLNQSDAYGAASDPVGFSPCFASRRPAIHSEIQLADLIRSQGYEVDAMVSSFDVDTQTLSTYCGGDKPPDDPYYKNAYFGTNIHPYEVVFMKANRGVDDTTLNVLTGFQMKSEWTSWDSCP